MSSSVARLGFFLANIPNCKRAELVIEPFPHLGTTWFSVVVLDRSQPEGDPQRIKSHEREPILEDAIAKTVEILARLHGQG